MEIIISKSSESVLGVHEKILLDLSLGRREPQNDYEKEMLRQIKEIEAKGGIVEIPSDW